MVGEFPNCCTKIIFFARLGVEFSQAQLSHRGRGRAHFASVGELARIIGT